MRGVHACRNGTATSLLGTLAVSLAATLVVGCGGSTRRTDADFCALARGQQAQTAAFNADFATAKPADLKPVVDKALAQLSMFDAAAPKAIAAATHTYVTDERTFLALVRKNNYDVASSLTGIAKTVTDPAFVRAGQSLTAYLMTTCHLGPIGASGAPSTAGGAG